MEYDITLYGKYWSDSNNDTIPSTDLIIFTFIKYTLKLAGYIIKGISFTAQPQIHNLPTMEPDSN